jgi:hypothetical protein
MDWNDLLTLMIGAISPYVTVAAADWIRCRGKL